uniref:Cell invasion protein sipD n=1 Tax=Lygus hesperus TaxID=30085 RepID=A0A0A9XRZ4_LYGHE
MVECMPLSYRQLPPEEPSLRSVEPLGKPIGFTKEKLPPHLATLSELNEYKQLLSSSIVKTQLTLDGEKLNTLQVDDLLKAKIKRAVLPEPFTSTVQIISVKLRGHLPNDDKNDLKCQVTFEWVTISGDKIASPPLKFDCNKTERSDRPTTKPTTITTEKPSTTIISKPTKVSPIPNAGPKLPTKIVQLPKFFKKIKQVTRIPSVPLVNEEASSKKPLAEKPSVSSAKPTVKSNLKTGKPTTKLGTVKPTTKTATKKKL